MIDTLIFDFDGVILDTETPDYQTWQEVFHRYGVELELSVWTHYIGGRSAQFDVCRHLEDGESPPPAHAEDDPGRPAAEAVADRC